MTLDNLKVQVSALQQGDTSQLFSLVEQLISLSQGFLDQGIKEEFSSVFFPSQTPFFSRTEMLNTEQTNWMNGRSFFLSKIENVSHLIKSEQLRNSTSVYIDNELIQKLSIKPSVPVDYRKLIQYLKEVNYNYSNQNYISTLILLRAVLNYIPPIFNGSFTRFAQVVNAYKVNPNTGRNDIFQALNVNMRRFGDLHTHDILTLNQAQLLPSKNQLLAFQPNFEYLIQEIIKLP